MKENPLVGRWKLVSHELRSSDGKVQYFFGENPIGYIMYGQDGYMNVAFMNANRPKNSAYLLPLATAEEKERAAVTFDGYCGRYEIKGDKVRHYVEVSLNPNYTGDVLERTMQLKDDNLVLTMPPFVAFGISHIGRLAWRRV